MLANIINHPDVEIEIDKDLKKYSTMRLDARGDLITVKSVDGLKAALKALTKNNIEYRALGWGANVLLPAIGQTYVPKPVLLRHRHRSAASFPVSGSYVHSAWQPQKPIGSALFLPRLLCTLI